MMPKNSEESNRINDANSVSKVRPSTKSINHYKEVTPGCSVTTEDFPLIVSSIICFLAFLVYGACVGSLGAALPFLAAQYNRSEEELGFAFTARGIGYFVGTLCSAAIIELSNHKVSLLTLVCISIFVVGCSTSLLALIDDYIIIMFMFVIQGIGAGGLDTFGNCFLPNIWDIRVSPWMQTMHCFFGIGAVVGPILLGNIGYISSFIIFGLASIIPLILCVLFYSLTWIVSKSSSSSSHHEELSIQLFDEDNNNNNGNMKLSSQLLTSFIDHTPPLSLPHSTPHPTNSSPHHTYIHIHNDSGNDATYECINPNGKNNHENKSDDNDNDTIHHSKNEDIPWLIRILITFFFLFYIGMETAYAGWVPTYALNIGVTESREKAAYISSAYWGALTIGRLIAIPLAIVLSTSKMLRIQLMLCLVGSLLILIIASWNYHGVIIASIIFGYALSSIFPLAFIFITDYGYKMNPTITTWFVVGSTIGEAIIPILVGYAMKLFGPQGFCYAMLFFSIVIVMLYIMVHFLAMKRFEEVDDDDDDDNDNNHLFIHDDEEEEEEDDRLRL